MNNSQVFIHADPDSDGGFWPATVDYRGNQMFSTYNPQT